ncbi:MAG TPA: ElyC/SanA/YdcF family protein [Candidatus Paceibacterota bacterium]|nr:ElyC/SanA/YdcF family protein [Candidatus Paceibacterota bacterium]
MAYPKLGDKLFGIVLSHDVARSVDHWFIAYKQTKSDMRLFGATYIDAISAALTTELVSKIAIVGGDEPEYGINRAVAIKTALVTDHQTPPELVQAVRSLPNTEGNAEMMRQWITAHFIPSERCVGITSIWHCARAAAFFHEQGMMIPFVPAESIWLAQSANRVERHQRALALLEEFYAGDLGRTVVSEAVGISQILDGTYQSR